MRRKEKEITDVSEIKAVIQNAHVCRLGMVDGDQPYLVPLCFGYRDNVLYFHGALKGRKLDIMRENANVCFEFDQVSEILKSEDACDWSIQYQSVVGFGKAEFIEDADEKSQALKIIMAQYSDRKFEFPENMLKATAVFKVAIKSMTGKQSG
jgi:nitroimidazol reductase NimA-like FMN-containing flavoprotein (pyridoxamine 5'-phosphate oxidase superfamily)